MSTSCGKDGTISTFESSRQTSQEYDKKQALKEEATGRRDQGNIGERIAAEYAVEHLGLFGIPFDQPRHGLDAVYENAKGELVLAESKLAESGLGALGNPSYGKQGSPSWIAECAKQMQTPGSGMYSETNAKIGERIEQTGVDKVHFVAISTDPQTFETTAYERQSDGSWQKIDR